MDQFTKALNQKGFGSIKLPREGIRPLQVVAGSLSDGFEIIGELQDALEGSPKPPEIETDLDFIGLNNASIGTYDAKAGTKVLSGFFKQLANIGINLDAYFKGSNDLNVRIENCKWDHIFPEKLNNYLNQHKVKRTSLLNKYSNSSKRIFVITDIIKSNSLNIEALNTTGGGAKIDVNGIKGIAEASGQMDISSSQSNKMSAVAKKYLTFGFKVIPISISIRGGVEPIIPSSGDKYEPGTLEEEPVFTGEIEYYVATEGEPTLLVKDSPIELKIWPA